MQGSTITTVKDILLTIVPAIITITVVDGGGGVADVVLQRKFKYALVQKIEFHINTDTIKELTMPTDEQEDTDKQAVAVQVTQDHLDTAHVSYQLQLLHVRSYHLTFTATCSGDYACQNGGTCVSPNTCCCLRTGYTGSVCNTGMNSYCDISKIISYTEQNVMLEVAIRICTYLCLTCKFLRGYIYKSRSIVMGF